VGEEGHDFDAIWRATGPTLWRAIRAYAAGRRDVADDAVAEAFARAIERDGRIRDPVPYLYRVAFRIAAAELRRDRGEHAVDDAPVEDDPALVELGRALRQLSPSQRAAVYLHYVADLPVREVATLMGTSAAAVRVHLMRGRRRLAELLGEGEPDD
jgi:RNA polymerase sigma-70 factor (ECF subfamily)